MTDLELRQEMIRRQIETDIHCLDCAYSYIQETSNREDYSLEALDRLSNAISDSKKLLLNHLERIMNNFDEQELLVYQKAFDLLLKDESYINKEYYLSKAREEIAKVEGEI